MLQDTAKKCRRIILNPPGGTDTARTFEASRAAQVLKGVERELDAVKVKLTGVSSKKISAAYAKGLAVADAQAKAAGIAGQHGSPAAGSFNLVDSSRAKVLVRETAGDLLKAVDSMKATTRRLVRQAHALGIDDKKLNQILAGGTIEGTPAATLMAFKKEVRLAAIDGKIITVNTRTGAVMHFKPDDYAELVFQTKQAEATNVATLERLQSRKMFYVKIIGSHSANFCTAFVDKVFYTGPGEDPLGLYPHIRTLPRGGAPFHPRCTKRYVAFNPKLASTEEIEKGKMSDEDRKRYLNQSASDAQKKYEQATKPPPAPPQSVDRVQAVKQQAADARRQLREIEAGYEQTNSRLQAEHEEIGKAAVQAADRGDAMALAELAERNQRVVEQLLQTAEQQRKSGFDVLKVEKPVSTEYVLDSALGPARRAIAEEGINGFAKLVDRDLINKLEIIVRPPDLARIGDRSYYSESKVHLSTRADAAVVPHELAHQLESKIPELLKASLAFLKRRTEGERLQSLKKLTGLNYGPNERAWPDDFFDPYVGKDYRGFGSEILTMGIETFYRNPFFLAKADPDHFEFVFKALRGVFE